MKFKTHIKTAVILCGGKGSRLGSLGKKIPKSMIKINGYPIIWYIINILKKNSFNHFILPIGYKGKIIRRFLKSNRYFKKLNIEVIDTGTNTNIAKRIYLIKKRIISKNFLLLNGDSIFDFNIKKIFNNHINNKTDMTLIGCQNQLPYGTVGVVKNKIVSFDRNITFNSVKVKNKKNFIAHVYSGMSVMKSDLLQTNFKNYKNFEKALYPKFINKFKCKFVSLEGFWHSIDNIKDIDVLRKNNSITKFKGILRIIRKIN